MKHALSYRYVLIIFCLGLLIMPLPAKAQITNLIVDRADDPNPATASACLDVVPNDCSLRGAINRANADAANSYSISFAPTLNGTPITLSISGTGEDLNATGDLDILVDLSITGNDAHQTIISAANIDRVFHTIGVIDVTLQDLTIRDGLTTNLGGLGGGIFNDSASLSINRSTLTHNQAQNDIGGGLANVDGSVTLSQSTVANNSTQLSGGGLLNYAEFSDATLTITNSTLSSNQAGNTGGALANADGLGLSNNATVTILNSTITQNESGLVGGTVDGGGLSSQLFGSGTAVINFQNSIISGNTSPNAGTEDCFTEFGGVLNSIGNNLTTFNTGCPTGASGDLTTNSPSNELVITLADNGGPTDTHNLTSSSLALDAGDDTICSGTAVNNLDQRGLLRPYDGNGDATAVCDIGAVEYASTVVPGADGGDGPGGVGVTDGSSQLSLWLNAQNGVTISGSGVSTWADQSGNGNDANQTIDSARPTNPANIVNNQPSIQFDGNNNLLNLPDFASGFSAGETFITIQVVNDPIPTAATGGLWDFGADNAAMTRFPWTTGVIYDEWGTTSRKTTVNPGTPLTQFNIYNVSSIPAEWANRLNGVQLFTTNSNIVGFQTDPVIGFSANGSGGHLEGNLPEMIIYNNGLTLVERILVENYLSALYAIDISASGHDVYDGDGDNSGNGDFDLNVAGIGRISGNNHTQAHSVGMIVRNATFLQEDGDWLLFGQRTPVNNNTILDLPSDGDWDNVNDQRWERHWYIDVTDNSSNGGTVDIIFDYSEGSMDGASSLLPSPPASNYRLLRRTNETGDFEDITAVSGATVNIVGDQVQFLGVDVDQLGSNFTLGTLDSLNSPTAVSLTSMTSANQNSQFAMISIIAICLLFLGTLYLKRVLKIFI